MNHKYSLALLITMVALLLAVGRATSQEVGPRSPQDTYSRAFTYQGQLRDPDGLVNATCDLRFTLWDAASGGAQVGSTLNFDALAIENGLFTVRLDFGDVHDGAARWLEAAVRCPAGSGDYAILEPRQELTAAPAALALALPHTSRASIDGPVVTFGNTGEGEAMLLGSVLGDGLRVDWAGADAVHVASAVGAGLAVDAAGADGVYVGTAGSPSTVVPSDLKNGFEVAGAEHYGLWVGRADQAGVRVNSAWTGLHIDVAGGNGVEVFRALGGDGVHVGAAGDCGFHVTKAGDPTSAHDDGWPDGVEVSGAEGNGFFVGRADMSGVQVDSAGAQGIQVGTAEGSGVYVGAAGSPSTTYPSGTHNGFEVAGAENFGLYVGRADSIGVEVFSAGYGLSVDAADQDGVNVNSAGNDGMYVQSAGGDGVQVYSAGARGFQVSDTAGYDGFYVWHAGAPSTAQESNSRNGFEVGGAQGHGLYVGRADESGVYVVSAGWNGIVVDAAGGDGVRATNTTYNALYGDTANTQSEWGLYTPDKIHAQNVTLQTLTLIAQVSGPDALEPGDVVAAAGVGAPLAGTGAPTPQVRLAGPDAAGIVGVVEGRLAFTTMPQGAGQEAGERLELRSAAGTARAGDYVALTVLGMARVRVVASQGGIQPGTRLTGGARGCARPLKTVVVDGVTLAENAPTIGIALAAPDAEGRAWVLVDPH